MGAMVAALLAACVVVPRTERVYDPDCQVMRRQMVLDVQQIGSIGRCHNEGCAAALVAIGAVAAASAVVSGSVVLVGNVVYWIEKQAQCRSGGEPVALPPPPATSPR